jgi:hypothetical protein
MVLMVEESRHRLWPKRRLSTKGGPGRPNAMGLRLLGANRARSKLDPMFLPWLAVVSPLLMFVAIVLAQRYGSR